MAFQGEAADVVAALRSLGGYRSNAAALQPLVEALLTGLRVTDHKVAKLVAMRQLARAQTRPKKGDSPDPIETALEVLDPDLVRELRRRWRANLDPGELVDHVLSVGAQDSSESGAGTDFAPTLCARCQLHDPVAGGGDLCGGCRAFLLEDSAVDPAAVDPVDG